MIPYVIDLCWGIILAQLPKTKVEVFLGILDVVGVESLVLPAVLAHSVVTEPYVVAQSREVESGSIIAIQQE